MAESAVAEVDPKTDGMPESDTPAFVPEPGMETPEKAAAVKAAAAVKTTADQERAVYEQAKKMSQRPVIEPQVSSNETTELKTEAKPEATKPEAAPDTPPTVTSTPEQREQEILYRRALERDGYPADDITGMKPEVLAKLGKPAVKRQKDYDRVFAENAKLKAGGNAGTSDSSDSDNASDQVGRTNRAEEGRGQTLDQLLSDELVLDDAEKSRIKKVIGGYQAQAEAARGEMLMGRYEIARDSLKGEFPGIVSDEHAEQMRETINRLDPSHSAAAKSVKDTTKLLRDVCFIVFGPAIKQQAQRDLIEQHRKTLDGQPDTKSISPPQKPQQIDMDRLTLEAATRFPGNLPGAQLWLAEQLKNRR